VPLRNPDGLIFNNPVKRRRTDKKVGTLLTMLTCMHLIRTCVVALLAFAGPLHGHAQGDGLQTGNDLLPARFNTLNSQIEKRQFNNALEQAQSLQQQSGAAEDAETEAWSLIAQNIIHIRMGDYKRLAGNMQRLQQVAAQSKEKKIMGVAALQLAQSKLYNQQAGTVNPLFQKALELLPEDDLYKAELWNDWGVALGETGNLEKEADCYLKAQRIYEKLENLSGLAKVNNNLSVLYNQLGKRNTAISHQEKAVAIREKLNELPELCNSYSNLSQLYLDVNLKTAEKYARLCMETAEKLHDENMMIQAYNTTGLVKDRQGKKAEIAGLSEKVLQLLEKQSAASIVLARQHLSVGIIQSELRMDSATAYAHLHKGTEMALALGDKVSVRDGYLNKAIFFKIRNDFYNAYENIKKYHLYKDSVINEKALTSIAEIETRYETEKKDNEINRLTSEQKIKQLKIEKLSTEQRIKQLAIEKQEAIIAGNQLLARQKQDEIALLSQKKELQELELKQQGEKLDKQLLLAKSQQQQLELAEKEKALSEAAARRQKQFRNVIIVLSLLALTLAAILFNRYQLKKKIQEQQAMLHIRDKIAKDLHDEVGSTLSSIKILSEVSYKNMDKDRDKAAGIIKKITEQSEQMQQSISDIVWAIKPDNDKLENISIRMREYLGQTLLSKNIQVLFNIQEAALHEGIGMQQRRDLLLIFKEAVNNIAKYAQAAEVDIDIRRANDQIVLHIRDNGIGFDTGKTTSSSGLKNMKSRTAAIGGAFDLQSEPGNGTCIKITIPFNQKT
jgi:two-component system, NarL family, sensor histidine kinase UhpB